MGHTEASGYCEHCQRNVPVRRETPNHVLHLLLTVLTCSLWIVVWALISVRIGGWRCAYCGSSAKRILDTIGILARVGLVFLAVVVVFSVGFTYYAIDRRGGNIPVNPSTVEAPPSPNVQPDPLAEYRKHVGLTAFNKTNGQEQGRIEGVGYVQLKGEGRVIAYKVRHKGSLRDSPVDNVEPRDVPSTVADAPKK